MVLPQHYTSWFHIIVVPKFHGSATPFHWFSFDSPPIHLWNEGLSTSARAKPPRLSPVAQWWKFLFYQMSPGFKPLPPQLGDCYGFIDHWFWFHLVWLALTSVYSLKLPEGWWVRRGWPPCPSHLLIMTWFGLRVVGFGHFPPHFHIYYNVTDGGGGVMAHHIFLFFFASCLNNMVIFYFNENKGHWVF